MGCSAAPGHVVRRAAGTWYSCKPSDDCAACLTTSMRLEEVLHGHMYCIFSNMDPVVVSWIRHFMVGVGRVCAGRRIPFVCCCLSVMLLFSPSSNHDRAGFPFSIFSAHTRGRFGQALISPDYDEYRRNRRPLLQHPPI